MICTCETHLDTEKMNDSIIDALMPSTFHSSVAIGGVYKKKLLMPNYHGPLRVSS